MASFVGILFWFTSIIIGVYLLASGAPRKVRGGAIAAGTGALVVGIIVQSFIGTVAGANVITAPFDFIASAMPPLFIGVANMICGLLLAMGFFLSVLICWSESVEKANPNKTLISWRLTTSGHLGWATYTVRATRISPQTAHIRISRIDQKAPVSDDNIELRKRAVKERVDVLMAMFAMGEFKRLEDSGISRLTTEFDDSPQKLFAVGVGIASSPKPVAIKGSNNIDILLD